MRGGGATYTLQYLVTLTLGKENRSINRKDYVQLDYVFTSGCAPSI